MALSNFPNLTKSINSAFVLTPPTSALATTYGTWTQVGNTITVDSSATPSIGPSISADGLTIAFSSLGDDAGGTNRGSVKVYRWINSTWTLLGSPFYGIVDSETFGVYNHLGHDGNTIAINYSEAILWEINTSKRGFTAVFTYNPSKTSGSNDVTSALFGPAGWSILGAPIYNESNGDTGSVPRLSGNSKIIAIGIPLNDGTTGNINDQRGAVRVFAYESTKVAEVTDQASPNFGPVGWTRLGQDIDGGKVNDNLGGTIELSLDGTILVVGISGDDSLPTIMGSDANNGVTKIYYWTGSTWTQRGRNIYMQSYAIYDESSYFPSTMAVSANGNIVALGSTRYGSYRGIASSWIWNPVSSDYMPLASQLNEFGDWQGSGIVSLSSDGTILANAAYAASNNTANGGTIRVYKLTTNSTTLISSAPSNMADYISDINFGGGATGTIYRVTITGAVTGGTVYGTNIYRHDSNLAMAAVHAGVVANGETKEVYVVMERPQVYWFGTTRLGVTSLNHGPVDGPYPLGSYGSYFFQTEPRHWLKIGGDVFGSSQQFLGTVKLSSNGTTFLTEGSQQLFKVFSINSFGQFSYTSSNTSVAQVYGHIVIPLTGGQTTLTAIQSASGATPQSTITATLSVSPGTSNLSSSSTFTVASQKIISDASFAIIARPTSNSSGEITYSSSDPAIATIDASGDFISLVGEVGDVSFIATQAETSQYASATKTSNTLAVRLPTTFSAATFAVESSKTYGDASFNITTAPTSNSDGAITYSSSNTAVATIDASGDFINIVGAGEVTFIATQAQTSQYASSTNTSNTLTVALATSNLSSSSTFVVASSKTYGDAPFAITTSPTSNSAGAITYSSSNTAVATIDASGNYISLVGAGEVTFIATQAQTSQYASATKTSNTLTVSKADTTLVFVSPPTSKNATNLASVLQPGFNEEFTLLTATGASSGAVTYTSNNTAIGTIGLTTGLVTLMGAGGTLIITASQASTAQYNAINATCSIVINYIDTSLIGQTVSPGTSYADVDFSGAILTGATLSGVSFSGASLINADLSGVVITGTNFTNANINGAINLPAFSTVQKLQLLGNLNNIAIGAIQINTQVSGSDINSMLSVSVSDIASATFTLKVPSGLDASSNRNVTITSADVSNNASVYIPLNANQTVNINGTAFLFNGTNILDANNKVRSFLLVEGVPFKLYAGSIIALNITESLNEVKVMDDGLYNIFSALLKPRST